MRNLGNNHEMGSVISVGYEDGVAVYDVRANSGAIYKRIQLRAVGASVFPVVVGQRVHLMFPRGAYDLPYIVGADSQTITESTPVASGAEDYSPDSRDLRLQHHGSEINLSEESGVTLSSTSTLRVQLPAGGVCRVSSGGVSDNHTLSAQPFLDELYAYIAELETAVVNMQAHIAAITAALSLTLPTAAAAATPPSPSGASKQRAELTKNSALTIP